jgi:hypothetical protein
VSKNSDGLEGQFDVSQSMQGYRMPEFGLSIEFPKGTVEVNDDRLCLAVNDGSKKTWYRHDFNDGVGFSIGDPEYFRENATFVGSLLNNQQCESSFEDASAVDYIISEVRKKA